MRSEKLVIFTLPDFCLVDNDATNDGLQVSLHANKCGKRMLSLEFTVKLFTICNSRKSR